MQQDQAVYGDVQFLTGSPHRRAVLDALCAEPARPHELCAEIDATRTTIQRILAGFREREWVVKHDGDYRATVTGRRVCEQYEALHEEVTRARRFGPLAAHLGPDADDLPVAALEHGRLTVSEGGSPLAALSRFTEWLGAVEGDMRAVSPVVAQPFNEIGAELLSGDTRIEFVIDSAVLEQSKARYEAELQFGVDHDQMTIYVHESPLSLGVALDDERCCVIAYDDGNNLKAILEAGDGELYDWATEVFERYRERSVPLPGLSDEGTTATEG
ncbi:helix-turn-helix transcriptional regulator [Haloarcula laminariae]|uniref:helix-turn-helix transcriptional regulator n=1 Tax=Haloarcula laminariae TaxID=2961577 RepID=UPI002404C3D5|nr:MarR family transcriptional regulator [Halomicroarcula sp. FL173]